ncbi:MAG: glycosyltransferase family 2 protein [Oscillospiraceae bacterium]
MNEKYLFSFIVPVYNTPTKYLKKCVMSIAKIKKCTYEIILIDDGSTLEETLITLEEYSRHNNIQVIHQVNAGVSAARNTGLDYAEGHYIVFVDSDDFIDTNVFENGCLKTIEQYPDESVFMFTNNDIDNDGNIIKMGSNSGNIVKSNHILNTYADGIKIGAQCIRESVWSKIFTKDIIGDNRFNTCMKFGEDNLFVLQVTLKLSVIVCGAFSMYNYRHNNLSATKRYTPTILQDRMINILEIEKLYKKYRLDDAFVDFCFDVINRTYLHLVLRLWVFHEDNPISFKKKCALAHEILDKTYFKEKLNGIDMKRLRKKDKVIIWLLKKNMIYLGYKLYGLNKSKFRFNKW